VLLSLLKDFYPIYWGSTQLYHMYLQHQMDQGWYMFMQHYNMLDRSKATACGDAKHLLNSDVYNFSC